MNIFVGNMLFETIEKDIRRAFEKFGAVAEVTIVMEKNGSKSRGFGFVEMPDDEEAEKAIAAMNEKEFMGRVLVVSPAKPKTENERLAERKLRLQLKLEAKAAARAAKDNLKNNPLSKPVYMSTSGRKIGRRTRSFLEKRAAAGINEPLLPRRKHHSNPMRWRKKQVQPKPWQKKKAV
ncbi:MAG: RNA-binding protein [Candidatus Omnitrophica bacterium]|jgi:RNA recognition motif-containing protein|nr:RNA-binding protein [Candidatus Omnitrophota bacterium]